MPDLSKIYKTLKKSNPNYLKESETGLDLLKLIPKHAQRYLVTGHFDQAEIQEACAKNGIYLIPKSEIAELPIVIV